MVISTEIGSPETCPQSTIWNSTNPHQRHNTSSLPRRHWLNKPIQQRIHITTINTCPRDPKEILNTKWYNPSQPKHTLHHLQHRHQHSFTPQCPTLSQRKSNETLRNLRITPAILIPYYLYTTLKHHVHPNSKAHKSGTNITAHPAHQNKHTQIPRFFHTNAPNIHS